MKNIIITCVLFSVITYAAAQDSTQKTRSAVRFQSIVQAGFLTGKNTSAFEVQSLNGIRWKTFSGSIGAGIDDYVFRTIPVFLDIRTDILNRRNTPFIFLDAGPQFCWLQESQKSPQYYDPVYKARLYFNAGAGYKINLKKNAIILSAAFSLKNMEERTAPYCDPAACPEGTPPIVNKYTFQRLSLKAGWVIW